MTDISILALAGHHGDHLDRKHDYIGNKTDAKADPAPHLGLAGGVEGALDIAGLGLGVHLGSVNNRDNAERQTTAQSDQDCLNQVIRNCHRCYRPVCLLQQFAALDALIGIVVVLCPAFRAKKHVNLLSIVCK